jgi:hypothetical protein
MSNHEDWANRLLECGYSEVESKGIHEVGQRVRHSGERYPEAMDNGTSTIEHIFVRGNDVELIIHRDKPLWSRTDTHSQWANFHTIPVNKFEFEK